jgi:hypothetical protein
MEGSRWSMAERRFQVNAAQTFSLGTFFARQVLVENLLPQWLYFRVGGSDIPSASTSDMPVAPMTTQLIPLPVTNLVSVGLGPVQTTLGQQVSLGQNAIVTFYDTPLPGGIGSINLNPTRLGQVHQETFVAGNSYTLTFPASQVHVQNYSMAWVYVAAGTLVAPTAATAMAAVPPMTERSLPCPPSTQFAFAFSAALVTQGQQVPAGIRVVATFYEYPTPVSIGTADLNPTKMGQMAQRKFVVASSYTIGFPATTVHVANYSQAWVYVKFGSLVIPTVATADVSLPPMSEKSLTCLPATDFAFGIGANLVTLGQQVPTGTQIIVTFFEYPTPISVGTADLNPSKVGQSFSMTLAADSVIDPAFPASQINISNYLRNWIYATYNLANRILNPDLETWAAGLPVNWGFLPGGGGTLAQSTPYRGLSGALITQVGAGNSNIYQGAAAVPGEILTWSFWYMTNGNQPFYGVWDITNAAWIIAPVAIGGPAPLAWTQFKVSFTVPAGCVNVRVDFYSAAVAGSLYRYDTICLQLATTAANAQIAVPPLSEKSITLPPSTHVDIVLGTQTVMAATNVPITQALLTLYEYAVPTNLGAAPLSPGGFRYSETVVAAGVRDAGALSVPFRNLSNFVRGRLSLSWTVPSQPDLNLQIGIFRSVAGAYITPIYISPYSQAQNIVLEFSAGCEVRLFAHMVNHQGVGIAGTVQVTSCVLEAW